MDTEKNPMKFKKLEEVLGGGYNSLKRLEEIFSLNMGTEVSEICGLNLECSKLLIVILESVVRRQIGTLKWEVANSFFYKTNVIEENKSDIDLVFFSIDRSSLSYGDIFIYCYNSIMHDNCILFYSMVYTLMSKISIYERLFFSDYYIASNILEKLYKAIPEGNNVNNIKQQLTVENEFPMLFNDYCNQKCIPSGGMVTTQNDFSYIMKSKYEINGQLYLAQLDYDFNMALKAKNLRPVIIEIDNYINTRKGKEDSKVWEYLARSILLDFVGNMNFNWNIDLSKDLLMCFCGLSQDLIYRDEVSVIEYNKQINNLVHIILGIIGNILSSELFYSSKSYLLPELSTFLINLYHMFPFDKILDFIKEKIIPHLGNYQHHVQNYVHILSEKRYGTENEMMISTDVEHFKQSIIKDVYIKVKDEVERYIIISLYVGMAEDSLIKVGLSFYNNKDEKIVIGQNPNDYMEIEVSSIGDVDGVYGFEVTILNIKNVSKVEAKILSDTCQKNSDNNLSYDGYENAIGNNKNPDKQDHGACYIATKVYGSYDAPEVLTLRCFRDEVLSNHGVGRMFIKLYYLLSPQISKRLNKDSKISTLIRMILNKLINIIEKYLK
ncbi:hypothetical protein SAMN05660462_02335 [Proteiniborus ethanoligenes]|uniref:Uncharacterized protein n=1 Tax=Proteiniborus ethanoligenes TaxID=415015 RepID=A0A1H3RDV6_9FIRM|nr:CFI-box-CTERM domain-containing protein [Proteiniborus ethanoligenes]SDZ24012.1 hypothetical protein SAMN05660462_02335 [Proteiniborus ethanoligenes]